MTPNTWHCNKHDQKNTRYSTNTTTQKQILYIPDLYRFLRTYSCPFKCCCFFQVSTLKALPPSAPTSAELRFNSLSKFLTPPLGSPSSPPVWLAVSTTVRPPLEMNERPRTKRAMFVYFGKVHGLQTPNSIQFFCDIFVSVFGMLVKIPMFGTKRKRKRL